MAYVERENSIVSSLPPVSFPVAARAPRATLSDVTEAVLEILRPDLERRECQVLVEVAKTSEFFDGDRSALAQVLADLLESVSRGALGNRVMVRVAMHGGDVVITAREEGLNSGMALARELTDRYGTAVSCCVAAATHSTEIVVRVRSGS